MRTVVYSIMQGDVATFMEGGIYGDNALKETPPDVRPFLVLKTEGPLVGMGRMVQWRQTFAVHDSVGDYTRIEEGLRLIRTKMMAAAPIQVNGIWLNSVEWEGDSEDLMDVVRGTNMKFSTYLLTGSGR